MDEETETKAIEKWLRMVDKPLAKKKGHSKRNRRKEWQMYNNVSREITSAGNQIFRAKSTLLDDCFFQPELQEYSMTVLDTIRKALAEAVPELSEKFNTSLLYFGYSVGEDEDKAYIYVQKKNLCIRLCISRDYEGEIHRAGFKIRYSHNFQGRAGWLTGWYVPHSTKNINVVVKYLSKAFEGNP